MPTETEEPRTEEPSHDLDHDHSHFEGGPVKTFLEHLEDLRWVLIKILSAVGVAFTVCLLAAPQVVAVVMYPLRNATIKHAKGHQIVTFSLGTNRLGTFPITPELRPFFPVGSNSVYNFQIALIPSGTNLVLAAVPQPPSANESESLNVAIQSMGPAGAFVVATKVAIYAGLIIASPFVFYFIATFVFPALKMMERKYIYRGLFFGGGLFLLGVSFCFFFLMPVALSASVQFSEWLGFGVTLWRAEDYIGFVCKFMLGMGLGFELPVVILILVKLGILNYSMLSKGRRYMIVISFVLGAVLTTPEVVTQVLMALPLLLLYEVTIWVAWYWERQERNRPMVPGQ
jgi:sec-independent protein translocase protein TatC